MILDLTNVAVNAKVAELDYTASTPEELIKPVTDFTYTDKTSIFEFGGTTYSFPWIVTGKYEKPKN